jgi:hypothetical protein
VGKNSRVDVAQVAYEETVLKWDTDATAAKIGSKIDVLRASSREALGFENQTGARITLDGTTLRDKQLKKHPHLNRCGEEWGGKTNITIGPKGYLGVEPSQSTHSTTSTRKLSRFCQW